ncbi:MAG: polysaccharide (de)acetylase [Crocinitomicaceae bacterium]|nr:polysaccharide (de)acetylase [Crocinitomicaceae bacterium]
MLNNLRQIVSRNLVNATGFTTNRKIIVFESDDWGSIRMPSNQVFDKLKKHGIPVDNSPYCKFDTLESNTDMERLFELLYSFKDFKGNHPIITANTVVANPDFEKIKVSNYKEYFYEPFTETLDRYNNHNKVYDLYKIGIAEKLFYPQFHGREHVNVELWLELLLNSKDFQFAFKHNMWGLSTDVFPNRQSIQATLDSQNNQFLSNSIVEGLDLFKKLFNYEAESFIANNYVWSVELEKTLASNGIKHLQGMKYQLIPKENKEPRKLVRHRLGDTNANNQIYGIRNCDFEPSITGEGFEKTIKDIKNAFFWKKPAIISTHRINFIGSLNENNLTKNTKEFKSLINTILTKWPDVEFITTMDLDRIIRNKASI